MSTQVLILLIDGLNLIRRIHAAQPDSDNEDEVLSRLESTVRASLHRALHDHHPSHACCVFDSPERGWRHQLFPEYKADRPPMPDALARVLPALEESIESSGIPCFAVPGFEADDVIATMAFRFASAGAQVVVLSTDSSFCQCVRPGVRLFDHFAGREHDEGYVHEKFGTGPRGVTSVLALAGLASSNIAGVKGIGVKTAARIVEEHGDMDSILDRPEAVAGRPGELLRQQLDEARLAWRLVRFRTDVQVGRNLNQLRLEIR